MLKKKTAKKQQTRDWGDHYALTLAVEDGPPFMSFSPGVVESLRYMLSRLASQEEIPGSLAFLSALREEGVTYISRALGTVMANDLPVDVCVVELNWWWWAAVPPGAPHTEGLAGVLRGEVTLDEALVETNRDNLTLLPAGRVPLNERPVVARSAALAKTLEALASRYDYLLLDVPAINATSDALPLASLADAACLVVRQGVTSMEKVQLAIDDIEHLPVLGVVMNHVEMATPEWLFKYVPQE